MVSPPSPPGPRARFPGAHLLAFSRDMPGFLGRLKREYGDVVTFRLEPERTVLLSHPEQIHEVLVWQHRAFLKGRRTDVSKQFLGEGLLNSEGALHQRRRHLLQPAFHRQRRAQYATVMTTSGARLRQLWQDGDTLDIAPAMMRVTLAVAVKTLSLNLSHFVARKIWLKRCVSPLRCRAHRLQRSEPHRGLLVHMYTTSTFYKRRANPWCPWHHRSLAVWPEAA